jgi:hypothetical protein
MEPFMENYVFLEVGTPTFFPGCNFEYFSAVRKKGVLNVEANLKYPYNRAEVINLHLP